MKNLTRKKAIEWVIKLRKATRHESLCLECMRPFRVCHDFEEIGDNSCGKASYGLNCLSDADYESSDISGTILFLRYIFKITDEELDVNVGLDETGGKK